MQESIDKLENYLTKLQKELNWSTDPQCLEINIQPLIQIISQLLIDYKMLDWDGDRDFSDFESNLKIATKNIPNQYL